MRTKQEILESDEMLDSNDITKICGCSSKNKAYAIIREIKRVSGNEGIAGKVTVGEYELWRNGGHSVTIFKDGTESLITTLKVMDRQYGGNLTVSRLIRILSQK